MDSIRRCFPSIVKDESRVFFENAGGTQIPNQVMDKMSEHMHNYNVQIDGIFDEAVAANTRARDVRGFVDVLINNKRGKVEFGSSATQLALNLSNSLPISTFENVVISDFLHGSMITNFLPLCKNIECWYHSDFVSNYAELFGKITEKTTLVILPHASNVTGVVFDIRYIVDNVRKISPNAKVMVDGVSFLPHRMVDVDYLNVDYYFVSFYKFFAPNISAVYVKNYAELDNLNHASIENRKLELGTMMQTSLYSLSGLIEYMKHVTIAKRSVEFDAMLVHRFYTMINEHEEKLIRYFNKRIRKYWDLCTMVKDYTKDSVCIFALKFKSFTHDYVTLFLNECGILCKYGAFHNIMLFKEEDNNGGVVRISLVHYNTVHELDCFFRLLDELYKAIEDRSFISSLFRSNNPPTYVTKDVSLTDEFIAKYDHLCKDQYYTSDRDRLYSMIDTTTKAVVGRSRFVQSKMYNNTERGNQIRNYQPINVINDDTFHTILLIFGKFVFEQCNSMIGYMHIHQMRVRANEDVSPVPEGIHQDGYSYVGILCVNRVNVDGGETGLYDNVAGNRVYNKILNAGEFVMFNDRKMFHYVSNIKPIDPSKPAYRDVMVITTVF